MADHEPSLSRRRPEGRVWVLSDLHIDVNGDRAPYDFLPKNRPHCDVVVIAGDICEDMSRGVEWALGAEFGVPVIYVGGNHEFYNDTRDDGLARAFVRAAGTNVHILQDSILKLPFATFLGATLWTDYRYFSDIEPIEAMRYAARCMMDHRCIRVARSGGRIFDPGDALAEHIDSRDTIAGHLAEGDDGLPRVVVTHHAPSAGSVAARYRDDLLTAAFASNLDYLMPGADLWIHGHVHHANYYRVGRCRVVSNPRGYLSCGEGADFRNDLVLKVDAPMPKIRPVTRR